MCVNESECVCVPERVCLLTEGKHRLVQATRVSNSFLSDRKRKLIFSSSLTFESSTMSHCNPPQCVDIMGEKQQNTVMNFGDLRRFTPLDGETL